MSLFKRIGTKAVKYNFELEFQKLEINLNFKCDFQIQWKRGSKHTLQTLRRVPYDINKGCALFSESLFLDATLFQSKKNGKYQPKESQIYVKFKNELGEKTAGKCTFELSQFANANITEKKMVIPLQSPDSNAKINANLIVTRLGEVDGTDSQISDDSFREENHQFGQNKEQNFSYKDTVNDDTAPIRETISEDRPSVPDNNQIKQKQLLQQQEKLKQQNQEFQNQRKVQESIKNNDQQEQDQLSDDSDLLDLDDEEDNKKTQFTEIQQTKVDQTKKISSLKNDGFNSLFVQKQEKQPEKLQQQEDSTKQSLQSNTTLSLDAKSRQKIFNYEQQLREKNVEIQELSEKIKNLELKIKTQTNSLDQTDTMTQMKIKQLQDDLAKVRKQNLEIQGSQQKSNMSSQQAQEKQQKLERDYKILVQDYQELRDEHNIMQNEYQELKLKSTDLSSNSKEFENLLKKKTETISQQQTEILKLRSEIKNYEADFSNLKTQNSKLKEQIQFYNDHNQITGKKDDQVGEKEDIEGLMQKIKDMEKELWEQKNQVRSLEQEKEENNSQITQLMEEITQVQFQRDQFKNNPLAGNQNMPQSEKEEQLQKQIDLLQNQLSEINNFKSRPSVQANEQGYKNLFEQSEKDLKQKMEIIRQLENQCHQNKEEINKLQKQAEDSNLNVKKFTQYSKKYEQEREIQKKEIDTLLSKIEKLNEQIDELKQKHSNEMTKLMKVYQSRDNITLEAEGMLDPETTYTKKIQNLEKAIEERELKHQQELYKQELEIKKLKDQIKNKSNDMYEGTSSTQVQELEMENANQSLEIENLEQKIKLLQEQLNPNLQSSDKIKLKQNYQESQQKAKQLQDQIIQDKLNFQVTEKELAKSKKAMQKQNDKIRELEKKLDLMEEQLVISKQKIGDAINIVMQNDPSHKIVEQITSSWVQYK